MSLHATSVVARAAALFALALMGTDKLSASPQGIPDVPAQKAAPEAQAPQAKQDEPAAQTPEEARADLYARLAAAKDADETAGIITVLLRAYAESGSDTADLLLRRARQ